VFLDVRCVLRRSLCSVAVIVGRIGQNGAQEGLVQKLLLTPEYMSKTRAYSPLGCSERHPKLTTNHKSQHGESAQGLSHSATRKGV